MTTVAVDENRLRILHKLFRIVRLRTYRTTDGTRLYYLTCGDTLPLISAWGLTAHSAIWRGFKQAVPEDIR